MLDNTPTRRNEMRVLMIPENDKAGLIPSWVIKYPAYIASVSFLRKKSLD
jgi:hypothetical protein